jgi:asparagine synthase (glutamine-hydrolysing)
MCGIAGIWMKQELHQGQKSALEKALEQISMRGPDHRATKIHPKAGFAHTRLSIIDTSPASNQPMSDTSGRYTLVFNGEIYNFKELAKQLSADYGVSFKTSGDTEVLLAGLIHAGIDFLKQLNGFFSFAFYDAETHNLMLARDRYGIKPLYYAEISEGWVFGSNLSACTSLGAPGEIDFQSLTAYLQLSYIPAPSTILKGVQKCLPGTVLRFSNDGFISATYYTLPINPEESSSKPVNPTSQIRHLLEDSVRKRLIADVPVGTFLSGGLDSSIISMIAGREHPGIAAFSIGFPDQPYFDESKYARATAKSLGLEHHVLEVREKDIEDELHQILDAFDEPFADSSAILVNMLSKYTRKEVKVALSGDGADELFGGYNKHRALLRSTGNGLVNSALKKGHRAFKMFPASRSHKAYDTLRKMQRYSKGLQLDFEERYWVWACFSAEESVRKLLKPKRSDFTRSGFVKSILNQLDKNDFNTVLKADFDLVLANDMLHKVDSMSMQHALEVRVPFLDHHLVNAVFELQSHHKLDATEGKKILRRAFEQDFPKGAFDRNKKGFEAPLGHWFTHALRPLLDQYCDPHFLEKQDIFDHTAVKNIRRKAISQNPGDAPHTLWAILVFQHWWQKHSSTLSLT